jgi:diaminopimelate epimerase
VRFVKGHGTENDFVLLPDAAEDELTVDVVRALCDRRRGIGADGVLRVVRRDDHDVRWFMDYRNADGSLAEMCGNGIRVFARYLVDAGLESEGDIAIGTRSGVRVVHAAAVGDVAVEMGTAQRLPDAKVGVGDEWWPASGWSLGNPHLVVTDVDIDGLDLSAAPALDPAQAYPEGVNVEFVRSVAPAHIAMRVHERGVGETRSCGTGACAAALAAMAAAGDRGRYAVDVLGGRLHVEWRADGTVVLTGPAVLVAEGDYRLA